MNADVLRAWWAHRQGLDGSLEGADPAEVLAAVGWARSVGGVGPYLTMHARAGTARKEADTAVAALAIHELPSARGCTYVVPAEDFALALTVSQGFGDGEAATARKLGVPDKEIDRLCEVLLDALADQPLDPAGIKDVAGDAARNLGPAGRKNGLATTLPVALGRLQSSGQIRRVPVNGRLDQQRYRYVRWDAGPLAAGAPSVDDARTELAERFFTWTGPATLGHFRWFSGLGAAAAKSALAPLDLVPVDGLDDHLVLACDAAELLAFDRPSSPEVSLIAGIDSLALLRRDADSLVERADSEHPLLASERGGGLADLPDHAIVDRGQVIGLWEFDPGDGEVVWATFAKADAAVRDAVATTEAFVRDHLGDARSFSLDSPESRKPRLDLLREYQ